MEDDGAEQAAVMLICLAFIDYTIFYHLSFLFSQAPNTNLKESVRVVLDHRSCFKMAKSEMWNKNMSLI